MTELLHEERVEITAVWLFRSRMGSLNNPDQANHTWIHVMEESQREDWRGYARWLLSDIDPPIAEEGKQSITMNPDYYVNPFPYGSVYVRVGDRDEPIDTMSRKRLMEWGDSDVHLDFNHHSELHGVEVLSAQSITVDNVEVWSRE